jgi:hypothetical protein
MSKTWKQIKDYNKAMQSRFEQINLIHDFRRCYANITVAYKWDMPMRPHINADTVTSPETVVMLCLWRHCKKDGVASIGSRWAAEQSCMDRKTWLRAVASLERKNVIRRKELKTVSKRPIRSIYVIRYENLMAAVKLWDKQCDKWEAYREKFNPDGTTDGPSQVTDGPSRYQKSPVTV